MLSILTLLALAIGTTAARSALFGGWSHQGLRGGASPALQRRAA